MPCENCRHAAPADATVFERGTCDGVTMTILDHPSFSEARGEKVVRCKAHDRVMLAKDSCEIFEKPRGFFGRLIFGEHENAVLYARLSIDRKIAREHSLREHERKTREAEALVGKLPCKACEFVHARCVDCTQAFAYCGTCSRCGAGVRGWKAPNGGPAGNTTRFHCSMCETPAAKPAKRLEWRQGRCDGCLANFLAREKALDLATEVASS